MEKKCQNNFYYCSQPRLMVGIVTVGASLVSQLVKNLPAMQETLVQFLSGEDLLEKGQATHANILGLPWWLSWQRSEQLLTPVFQPGEFRGLYSPWGRKESDTTERRSLSLFGSCIQGNQIKKERKLSRLGRKK